MTFDEEMDVREGVRKWAEMAVKHDWMNERRWWTRLVHWAAWKFRRVYLKWYDADEITASIMGYIEMEHYGDGIKRRIKEGRKQIVCECGSNSSPDSHWADNCAIHSPLMARRVQCHWHVTCVLPDGHGGACFSSYEGYLTSKGWRG